VPAITPPLLIAPDLSAAAADALAARLSPARRASRSAFPARAPEGARVAVARRPPDLRRGSI